MLKLAYQYMKYYRSQSFAILASILLTAALLSGIGSLMLSSRQNDLENARSMYGDWHYCVSAGTEACQNIASGLQKNEAGFRIEKYGKAKLVGALSEPYEIQFLSADSSCREMLHREIAEGKEPETADEIAADHYTLANLGFAGEVGDTLKLGERSYVLAGITKSRWASGADDMVVFIGEGAKTDVFRGEDFKSREADGNLIYLKFDENEKLYKQMEAFRKAYHISDALVEENEGLTSYLGGEKPDSIYDIVKFALTDEDGNFTYIILKLKDEYDLAFNGMIGLLLLFALFVIYSVFNISVSGRKAEYALLETLGISEGTIGGTLVLELWILFFAGYPLGCFLGNGFGLLGWQAPWKVIAFGFIFLLFALTGAGFLTVWSMRRKTLSQAMRGDISFTGGIRRIYSKRNANLANVVVRKFLFSNKKKAVGIILSLAIGGCIFLCTIYMVENLKVHAEMSMKSDDGLDLEYRVSLRTDSMADMIPAYVAGEIKSLPEFAEVYATKCVLGELVIKKEQLEWDEYFDQANKDGYFQERYGGICVDKGDGTCGIKYDVYGYDDGMIEGLSEFLLEGEIDPKELEKKNQVVAVANMDGQGNYNFYGIHPRDTVTLRVPKETDCLEEILKFNGDSTEYIKKEFEVAAVVSRPLAREESFLNVNNWSDALTQSIIMTNQQMEDIYGISDYSIINASPVSGADPERAAGRLLKAVEDVPKAVFKDYTTAIKTQKKYLGRQQLFFTGIAAILLVISLFHIMNSMNYSILARRREYGIIRAMGITDAGFYRMILRTGILYGVLTDVLIFLIYNRLLRVAMDYYMVHIVQFLHVKEEIPPGIFSMVMVLNILIAALAVMIPARRIAAGDIIGELRQ